jgi:hypothetical protein
MYIRHAQAGGIELDEHLTGSRFWHGNLHDFDSEVWSFILDHSGIAFVGYISDIAEVSHDFTP